MQGNRDVVADCAVGSIVVVVSAPILQLFAGVRKAHEPVRVQAFRPEFRIERLDEPVVGGLSGPREVRRDIVGIGPEIEVAGDELVAVIDSNGLRIADLGADPLQGLDDILPAIGEPGIGRRTEAGMGVDHGQGEPLCAIGSRKMSSELLTQGELVVDEIHDPDIVRPNGFLAIYAQLGRHPPLGVLVPELKA